MPGKYDLFSNVGIDSMGFYTPRLYLDIEDLAQRRKVDPDKFKIGLLLREMRLPELDEDIIAMGTKAGYYALLRGNIHPKDIDAVFVGTETMTYAVKSASNIFAQLLGIPSNSITQDVTNACASGTLAILNAIALVDRGIINKALVICADISSYELDSPSEATQGAGAIALIISKNPRIAKFSKKFGKVSGNVTDFFRPAHEKNAQVFGKYSVKSYLNFQLKAYDDLMEQLGGNYYANFYTFHAPFSKLPIKSMQQIIEKRWMQDLHSIFDIQLKDIKNNFLQKVDSFLQNLVQKTFTLPEYIYLKLKERGFSSSRLEGLSSWIQNNVQKKLIPQLRVPSHFGNMYSASVWAQILYTIENFTKAGDTIYFGSYGSGATCISGLLQVQRQFEQIVEKGPNIADYIQHKKTKITMDEYEEIKKGIVNSKIGLAKIYPHPGNENRGFSLHFCDKGCIIPPIDGLNHCPRGHKGFSGKFFPLYAVLDTDPLIKEVDDMSFLHEGYVRVDKNAKKGDIVEYEIRRINVMENDEEHNVHGILNWVPTYYPISRIY